MNRDATFTQQERTLIDAVDAELRKITPPPGNPEAGFPYARHHRVARATLRETMGAKAPSRHRQIAGLLLDWARACGDVRLYVYRPYVNWMREQAHPMDGALWDKALDGLAAAPAFEDYVAGQTIET